MGQRVVFADAEIDLEPRARRLPIEPGAETPFRIALIGDFRGRANRGLRYGDDRLQGCRPWPVDKDDFHELIDRVAPRLETAAGPLELRDLDDFHPDALFAEAPVFVELRRLRRLLRDPDSFRAAARELFSEAQSKPSEPATPPPSAEGGDVLDAILQGGAGGALPPAGSQPAPRPAAPSDDEEWKSLIRGIVKPHLVPRADPRQQEMLAQLDEAVAEQMRMTLHDPAFQSLEAAWRSVFLLLDRLETGVDLKIELIDLSEAELLADVGPAEEIEGTGLHRLLVDEAAAQPGVGGWSVVACLHSFGCSGEELRALEGVARIAAAAGTPVIAGAAPQIVGCAALDRHAEPARWSFEADSEQAEAGWRQLRAMPEAEWLALAMPRFLLRSPYGEEGYSTDLPGFEELPADPPHEQFLWGPAAAACACLLGESFMRQGWSLRPGTVGMLDRRPIWHAGKGADREPAPCAEVWLTDSVVERMLERGLTPLVSIKGRDAVAVARLQSIADPPKPLRGPWSAG